MKLEISKRIIATTILMSLILVLILVIIFSLINEKGRIQSALNLSQHNREQLLRPERVTESLLLVEVKFKEYSITFQRAAFEEYKAEVKNLVENIHILNQLSIQDSVKGELKISRIFKEKSKEADIYVRLKIVTDSLLLTLYDLEEKQYYFDKYFGNRSTSTIDTLSIQETKDTYRKGLFGKIKTAIVGEKIHQNKDTKILVQSQNNTGILSPDSLQMNNERYNAVNIRELMQKNRELKESELKLISLNNSLIAEIRKCINEIKSDIRLQESALNSSFLSSVRNSTNILQNILIFLMLLACILVGYIIFLAYKNDKFQNYTIALNQKISEDSIQKDKFFSIISHDLIGPFTSLLGFSEMLNEAAKKGSLEDSVEYSTIVNQSAKRILNLLQNLLIWAKMNKGIFNYSPTPVNIFELISNAMLIISPTAKGKKVELNWNVAPDLEANIDVNMISSVIQNLATNAIKFTQKGGSVTVKSFIESGILNFVVSDTGIGMNELQLEKLFKLDSNSSARGTENEIGTGLGLIICKEFIDLHQGKIYAKSTVGKGSTFYVTIPLVH